MVPVRHTIVNSIGWVQVGVKKRKEKKNEKKSIGGQVRVYWVSGCGPWNNRTKETFEAENNRKRSKIFFFKKFLKLFQIAIYLRKNVRLSIFLTFYQRKIQSHYSKVMKCEQDITAARTMCADLT